MDTPKYQEILEKLGLNKNEAQIYELLLENGPKGMKSILFSTQLKRGNAYYHLDSLKTKGLIETQEEHGRTKFIAKSPEQLELLLAKQKAAISAAQEEFGKTLPALRSLFQLAAIKPDVKFYEGLEGIIQVANDSLTSSTDIYSYIDNEAVNKYYPELNKEYVQQRTKAEINKKMITIDSPYIRERVKSFNKNTTQVRVIPAAAGFATVMQIYDNKVSYISMPDKKIIGLIIEHPAIYQMHKTLFEALWQTAKAI